MARETVAAVVLGCNVLVEHQRPGICGAIVKGWAAGAPKTNNDPLRGSNMAEFLFQVGQRVRVRETNELGTVEYRGTTGDATVVRFYKVRFEDGQTKRIPENQLLPA